MQLKADQFPDDGTQVGCQDQPLQHISLSVKEGAKAELEETDGKEPLLTAVSSPRSLSYNPFSRGYSITGELTSFQGVHVSFSSPCVPYRRDRASLQRLPPRYDGQWKLLFIVRALADVSADHTRVARLWARP